jgi:hypothetical protein
MAHMFACPINRRKKPKKPHSFASGRLRYFPGLIDLRAYSDASRNTALYPGFLPADPSGHFGFLGLALWDMRIPLIQECLRDSSEFDITDSEIRCRVCSIDRNPNLIFSDLTRTAFSNMLGKCVTPFGLKCFRQPIEYFVQQESVRDATLYGCRVFKLPN